MSYRSASPENRSRITEPSAVAAYLMRCYFGPDQEVFGADFLDAASSMIVRSFRGTEARAAAEPRQVIHPALPLHAQRVLVFHTYLIGGPTPSPQSPDRWAISLASRHRPSQTQNSPRRRASFLSQANRVSGPALVL